MTLQNKDQYPVEQFEPPYIAALDEIYHSRWAARKQRRMTFLREVFQHFWPDGHPAKLIHVTGTNGKGSVIHYLEQGLPGVTGSWTGPHVFDYAERFHIRGQQMNHEEIVDIYRQILVPCQDRFMKTHPGESLTFAELGILLSLHLFQRHKVEWGLMEVGAGGRYTPLMALPATACILTNVGDDHPKTLGAELWQRALEKSGIARPNIPFFTSATEPALQYVRKAVAAEGAPIFEVDDADIRLVKENLKTGNPSEPAFKYRNLALVCKVIRHFYPDTHIAALKMDAHLPARFKYAAPNVIIDMAHNVNKISVLAEQLTMTYPGKRFRFILGLSRSRDVREVFSPLLPLAEHIVLTGASYAGQDPVELGDTLRRDFPQVESIPEPADALEKEKKRLKPEDILVLTGSAYMIDQALNPNPFLKLLNATFGRRDNPV